MASFGDKLRGAREVLGLTQAQLAERSGVPLGTIREYEQNKREPLVSKAGKLAQALNRTIEALLPSTDDATDKPPAKSAGKPAATAKRSAASPKDEPASAGKKAASKQKGQGKK